MWSFLEVAMNTKLNHVLLGFKKLSNQDRKEFFEIIKGFEKTPYSTEREIDESIGIESLRDKRILDNSTVNFGPAPGGCPCCGK